MKALTPEETTYLCSAGFVVTVSQLTARRHLNSVGSTFNQGLTLVPSNPKDPHCPWYWTAVAVSDDENTAMELVVSSSEKITDVTVAFVTAEVRGWRRV